jgi:uridine kinase
MIIKILIVGIAGLSGLGKTTATEKCKNITALKSLQLYR